MPKIIFWNIARAKGAGAVAEDLDEDLGGLAAQHDPDVIVLCEGLKGLRKALNINGYIPTGYASPKFAKDFGNYRDAETLRYILLHKSGVPCQAYLVDTLDTKFATTPRPALAIFVRGQCVIALHNVSITASARNQAAQMISAYDGCVHQVSPLIANATPCLIFGDLNIDARSPGKLGGMQGILNGSSIQNFIITEPGEPTHRNGKTRVYDTTLDWALASPGLGATVRVINAGSSRGTKRKKATSSSARKRRKQDQDFVVDDDDDVDFDHGEEEFEPKFQDMKSPDHKPILINW